MNKITFIENLGPMYRNRRRRKFIKRRVLRMEKAIRIYNTTNKV